MLIVPTNNPSVLDRTSNVGVVAGCLMRVWSLSELIRIGQCRNVRYWHKADFA